jgi:Na+/H+-dicarboxylate symporter
MNLSTKIIIGLILGIAVGLFFGEEVAFLKYGADAFILLLQMSVLPYIVVALIGGLGGLTLEQAKALASRGGIVLLLLWGVTLAVLLVAPLAYPEQESASFFSTSLIQEHQEVDFLRLYIPANPFHSLANTAVPAVVFFSIAMGLALMGIQEKAKLLDGLTVAKTAITRIIQKIVLLTPYGIFCIVGHTAGTLSFDELRRLQIYAILYVCVSLFLAFWILPGLVTACTPIRYGQLFGKTRDALTTAFLTGNLLIVLPLLTEKSEELLKESVPQLSDSRSKLDVIISTSFNFPTAGKLSLLMFISFATWFLGSELAFPGRLNAAFMGLCTLFGSVNVAVPFLLDALRIPADMFQMFVSMNVLHARFSTLLSAMHILVLGLLGTCAMSGLLKPNPRRLMRYTVVSLVSLGVFIAGSRVLLAFVSTEEYTKDKVLMQMQLRSSPVPVQSVTADPPEVATLAGLERIQARGVLRVGFLPDSMPYAYQDANEAMIGFDVDMAYQLAHDLEVTLEFVEVERLRLAESLQEKGADLLMSGYLITPARAQQLAYTAPIMNETMAFVVQDHRRQLFSDIALLQQAKGLRIGIFKQSFSPQKIQQTLPLAKFVPVETAHDVFLGELGQSLDAVLVTAERGSAWCLRYPAYTVAIPRPSIMSVPMAYVVTDGDPALLKYMDTWIHLKKNDKTVDSFYRYWILGENAEVKWARWCVMRDVLEW